jgi:aspartate aminotransferase
MPQVVSEAMARSMEGSSMIRKLFEEGARLKALHGETAVHDFSLGNPMLEPPPRFREAIFELLKSGRPGLHRYIPNAGVPEVRAYVAGELAAETSLPFQASNTVMVCGAGGGLNVVFKAMLNPGDEVIAPAPYFVEYDRYVDNHGGRLVHASTTAEFQLDLAALDAAATTRTRAVILNSPNNPTGVVYPESALRALADWLRQISKRLGRPVFLISDEPYRKIVFDGVEVPSVFPLYEHSVVVTSHSKDLGLAAERIGYIAVHPQAAESELLGNALVLANRILGFVNAPALMQRVLPLLKGEMVDVSRYQALRDRMLPALRAMGYECVTPHGAFYLFPRSPIPDDVAFCKACQEERLLVVPGSAFRGPGHFRIALCVEEAVIDRALPVFERVFRSARPASA